MNSVFAICERTEATFGFFHVALASNGSGVFSHVQSPERIYPSRGAIWVSCDIGNGAPIYFGNYGVFEISEAPQEGSSKFMATRSLRDVYEVVSIPQASTNFTTVSKLLSGGLEILSEIGLKSSILLQFSDGVIAGPFEMRVSSEDRPNIAVCEEPSLLQPKACWKALPTIETRFKDRRCRFYFGKLPVAEFYSDFAPFEQALRSALKVVIELKQIDGLISVRKGRELAHHLSMVPTNSDMQPRIKRLLASLNELPTIGNELSQLLQAIAEVPSIKQLVQNEIEKAKIAAIEKITAEQASVVARIQTTKRELIQLNGKKSEAETAVAAVIGEIERLKVEARSAESELSKAVATELAKIQENAHNAFAKIAVLKPLLGISPQATYQTDENIAKARLTVVTNGAKQLTDIREAHRLLVSNLLIAGMRRVHATEVATVALAALLGKAAFSVRGSMSRPLTEAIALSLLGESWIRVEVPIGLADPIVFPSGGGATDINALLFAAANRSCPDAYVPDIIAGCRPNSASPSKKVLFELSEAQSALPPSTLFSEIGPIIHSDVLLWDSTKGGKIECASLNLSIAPDPVEFEEHWTIINSIISKTPNASFSLHLRQQVPLLCSILKAIATAPMSDSQVEEAGFRAIILWWIMPYLAAQRAGMHHLSDLIEKFREDTVFNQHRRLLFPVEEVL